MNTIIQEIFATGKWNGFSFTLNDLRKMATSFHSLKNVLQVPLKFGHNKDQPMTDGAPAIGWVSDVFVKDTKLVAEFSDIPDIVYNAMEKKLYRNVSIELDFDVEYKNSFYDFVLTGVALLGSSLPAVNVLNDLTKYMTSDRFHAFSKKENADYYVAYSHKSFTMNGDNMSEDNTKAELEILKAKLKAESEKFAAERKNWEVAEAKRKEDAANAKFTSDKANLEKTLENLIAEKKIFPNQREGILKDLTRDNIEQRLFTVGILKDSPAVSDLSKDKQFSRGSGTTSKQEEGRPDDILLQKIAAARLANPGMTFTNAKHMVYSANPDLASRYLRMDGMID
jgi:hypothetical protein